MLLPGLLIGGIAAHLGLVWLQKHTQYRTPRTREDNVVGLPFWPGQVFRSIGLFFLTAAVVTLVAGLIEINPVWLYGPYVPYVATVPAQPDWYVGWLEGALRLGLPIEPTILGVTIPSPFVPGVLIPGLLVGALAVWPFVEARLTHDHAEHHLLDPPWRTPIRTATGAAGVALFLVLTLAGGNDVLATILAVPVEGLTTVFRVLLVVAPVVTWIVVYRLAKDRRARAGGPRSCERAPGSDARGRLHGGRPVSRPRRGEPAWARWRSSPPPPRAACPRPGRRRRRTSRASTRSSWAAGIVVGAIVWVLATVAILRSRRRREGDPAQTHGNVRIEALWTAIPLVTVLALFVLTIADAGHGGRQGQRRREPPRHGVPLAVAGDVPRRRACDSWARSIARWRSSCRSARPST